MGRNLVGYFCARPNCEQYSVKIISDIENDEFDEITLAGESPFVVTYSTSDSPFGNVRYSTAAITAVANEYFLDVVGEEAQSTRVILTNEDRRIVEWVGFLTSNLLNMPQDSCVETFTIQAEDCLSSLKHYNYELVGEHYSIASFQQILAKLMQRCTLINEMLVDRTMKSESDSYIGMVDLKISEKNFFSSDTEEPWKCNDVLEEIVRYLGYTAIQIRDKVILFDYQAHASTTFSADRNTYIAYYSSTSDDSFSSVTNITMGYMNPDIVLNQDKYRQTGSDISLETIYNKVYVKDSFYEIDSFIPDFFSDNLLTNQLSEFWKCEQVPTVMPWRPWYVNEKNSSGPDARDANHNYYMRTFKNKYYDYIYRDDYGTIVDTDKLKYSVKSYQIEHDTTYYNVTGFTLQLEVSERSFKDEDFTIKMYYGNTLYDTWEESIGAGETKTYSMHMIGSGTNVYYQVNNETKYSYTDTATHNDVMLTKDYMGATIVDIANITVASIDNYNYEVDSSLNFDRYICISQKDNPLDNWCNPRATGMTMGQKLQSFMPLMRLSSGYTNPVIIDDKCFLSINGKAIFERYTNRNYINPDWTSQCTGIDKNYNVSAWGIISGQQEIWTSPPALVFLLKIGDYYWDGTQWTTTKSLFWVNLHTPTNEAGDIDFSEWWNKEHAIINNVSWEDWAGTDGYKIPLTGVQLDFNSDISFELRLPSKIQIYKGNKEHSGFNSYCWLKDLDISFATKLSENYDNGDILYENIINSGSVNELKDITCKITTYPQKGMHSYSNVGYNGTLLEGMKKVGLDDEVSKPEENIVKAYYNQYSTPTIKQTMTIDLSSNQLSRINDTYLEKYFIPLGGEIDYANGSQRVTLIESKIYNE